MLSRRQTLLAAAAMVATAGVPAFAASPRAFDAKAFADAQKTGKPILVAVHASWCPTCAVQKIVLSELMTNQKHNELVYFVVDFDSQKDVVRQFGARAQSTLISFKGSNERGRLVGDTDRASIAALLNKIL